MCRTNCCKIRETCCPCCIDLEKTDVNLDYGDYYYEDGERRQDVMEVTFWFPSSILTKQCLFICTFRDFSKLLKYFQMQDNNPAYESARNPNQIEDYDYMWSHNMGQKRPSVHFPSVPHLSSLHIRKPFDMTLLELIRPICKFKNILFSSCFVCCFILCSSCYNWMWNICLQLSTPSHHF